MPSIVIRLDPAKLTEPDLDLRYDIPSELAERSAGLLKDDGYDYEDAPPNAMLIYLQTSNLDAALPFVISYIETERPFGNDLRTAATVGVSSAEPSDATSFDVVLPAGSAEVIRTTS